MGTVPPSASLKEASGSQATGKNNSSLGDVTGTNATENGRLVGLKEHDYMGLSTSSKEHRRTQLQLGLPGSPDGEEPATAATGANAESRQQSRQQPQQQPEQQRSSSSLDEAAQQSRAPVGWPPLQSFRKNSLTPATQPSNKPSTVDNTSNNSNSARQGQQPQATSSLFVKVYMDGVPIGRKVNLRTHGSYDKLSVALEDMFRRFISGQAANGGVKPAREYPNLLLAECKKFNFMYGSDYVLTYEDRDGDLMLVGDVPWELFVGNVKRLRIMKGSEAIGLAPRSRDDSVPPVAAGN